jgi:hypothetical protein
MSDSIFTGIAIAIEHQLLIINLDAQNKSGNFYGNFIEIQALDATQDTYRGIVLGNRIDNGIWFNPNDSVWFGTWTATLE